MQVQLDFWPRIDNAPSGDVPGLDEIAFSLQEGRYFYGPVVLPKQGGWPFPSRLRPLVSDARLALILCGEEVLATELEALGYLSALSLMGPLQSEWANITFFLTDSVLTRWQLLPTDTTVSDVIGRDDLSLDRYTMNLLNGLRGDIRRSVVKNSPYQRKT